MKVHLQFFSRLRDLTGASEIELEVPEVTTIANVLEELYSRAPALREWDKSILVAVGVEFVKREQIVRPDDQISIMPPVQGG